MFVSFNEKKTIELITFNSSKFKVFENMSFLWKLLASKTDFNKDRKTERQKDRKTERQKDRKIER
jgi:hypothetical protein